MCADMDITCTIQSIFDHCLFRCRLHIDVLHLLLFFWNSREYAFQSSFPCSHCFIQAKLHLSIGDCVVCCHFSKECIRNRKFFKSFCRYFCDQIPECRCKQFTLINCFFQFYTHAISKCHLTYRCCNSVSVQRIGRNNLTTVDIFRKFCILIF